MTDRCISSNNRDYLENLNKNILIKDFKLSRDGLVFSGDNCFAM
jgi:hypothetical protein